MKKVFLVISIMTIFVGASMFIYSFYNDKHIEDKDKELVEEYFNDFDEESKQEEEELVKEEKKEPDFSSYLAVLEIPSLSLKTGIVMSNASYSTMNKNVSIFPTSDMPNIKKGNFVLFAHNGNSAVSYFRNISKLKNGNDISVYYNGREYKYKVIKKYDVIMTDNTPLNKMKDKTIITLITCKKGNNKYRTVVIGELVE